MLGIAAGVVLLLALIVGVLWGVGYFLPAKHALVRSALYRQPAERVWALVATPADHPRWRKDVKRVELLEPREGRPVWVEHGGNGRITYEQVESDAPRRLVSRIADPKLPFGGTWTLTLVPEDGGTRLVIREDGEVRNRIFRTLATYVFGFDGTMSAYLRALGTEVGESVQVRVDPSWQPRK